MQHTEVQIFAKRPELADFAMKFFALAMQKKE
jgi:hypothetical protein